MTDKELYLLTHPEEWPYEGVLPVTRRGGDPIYNEKDCGVVIASKINIVFANAYVGEPLEDFEVMEYPSPEALLSEWKID
jgi:hypothetical protein